MDQQTPTTSISSTARKLLEEAIVAIDVELDELGETNGIITTEQLAEEAGVNLSQAEEFCSELLGDKILRQNQMCARNQFLIDEKPFKKWKARLGIP